MKKANKGDLVNLKVSESQNLNLGEGLLQSDKSSQDDEDELYAPGSLMVPSSSQKRREQKKKSKLHKVLKKKAEQKEAPIKLLDR